MPSSPGTPPGGPPLITPANLLTVSRLVFLPAVIIGIVARLGWLAVGAVALTVVSDLLDGRVARRMRQSSPAGGTLDSVIDFVFIYALFITLYAAGRMTLLQFLVIYLAMLFTFLMQVITMIAAGGGATTRTRFGKPAGALQYAYLLFLVIREVLPVHSWLATANTALFLLLAIAILLSCIECVVLLSRLRRAPAGTAAATAGPSVKSQEQ